MSLLAMLAETVTIQTTGSSTVDRYNQPIIGVTATANVPARVEQTDSVEVSIGEATVVSDWKIFLLPDVTIANTSRVVDQTGRTFEVVGAPEIHRTPAGAHHIEARLRYVA